MWAFGVFLYELLVGVPPYGLTGEDIEQKIIANIVDYTVVTDPVAVDLISKLLVTDPAQRLTAEQVLSHEFFSNAEVLEAFFISPEDWCEFLDEDTGPSIHIDF